MSGAKPSRPSHLRVLVGVVLLVLVISGVVYYVSFYPRPGPSQGGPSLMRATCRSVANSTNVVHTGSGGSGANAYFLIVEADPPSPNAGINGSYSVPVKVTWPVMHVRLGQTVSIHVINCASGESHGFQIQSYDDQTRVSIQPGQSYDVTFVATRSGTFRVYCEIFCAIHPFMQNGQLVVT